MEQVRPHYQKKERAPFSRLRKEVFEIVRNEENQKRWEIKVKAFLFPALYFGTYAFLLMYGQSGPVFFLCYFFLGLFLLFNFINLIHEAVHHTLFKKKWMNRLYIRFFDLLGANSYIWKLRHIKLHHRFPNVMNWDSDFEQSSLAKIFPQAESKKFHKYQHLYLPFIYPLYLFNWLLVRDFKDFFSKKAIIRRVVKIPFIEYVNLFFFKIFYFFYLIVIPKLVLGTSWTSVLLGFSLMILTASLLSLIVLLSPHANIDSEFPQQDESGLLPYSWMEHQLRCTNDVTNNSRIIGFLMGNFNYHIAHHLFPNFNHIHYPSITRAIVRFAEEHNLPYRRHSLWESLRNHYKLLKINAQTENIFEETM